jgi:hypothetical protein
MHMDSGGVEHGHHCRTQKTCVRTLSQTHPYGVFRRRLILRIAAAGPRRSSRRESPPLCRCRAAPPWVGSTALG